MEPAKDGVVTVTDPLTTLEDLRAKATLQYSLKKYSEASDYYAQATELQAEINGEMSAENAELLYLYGKSLYQVGVSKSDVLGGNVAGEAQKSEGESSSKKKPEPSSTVSTDNKQRVAEEGVAQIAKDKEGVKEDQPAQKPFFQFTGDQNLEDSEDEDDANEGAAEENEEGAEEEDDLAVAWTVLDLARHLFVTQLEESESAGKGKGKDISPDQQSIKERLADTHDLLAEISLEGERFPEAAKDFKSSLDLRKELYPLESPLIGEGHFKLSLALEFASTTTTADDNAATGQQEPQVDEALREQSAREMESAIASSQMRIKHEENLLITQSAAELEKSKISRENVDDLKEMVADMEQRLKDLRAPPISVNSAVNGPAGAPDGASMLNGLLGSILGESPAEQKTRVEEAVKNANDLTGLVRRKKPEEGAAADVNAKKETNGSVKRKVEDTGLEPSHDGSKKAKVEDAPEE